MANPESASKQGEQESTIFNRKNVGRALEIGGAIFGFLELLDFNIVPALVGGTIYLLGSWIQNSGKDA